MEDKRIVNQLINDKNYEHMEAIPGPAIVISKETYQKMQQNNQAKQNQERLKQYEPFFKRIKDKNQKIEDKQLTF